MKIAMVFDNMLWGGIERVGITYINILCNYGVEVDVYILDKNTEDIIKEINPNCKVSIIDYRADRCPENSWPLVTAHDYQSVEILAFAIKYFILKILQKVMKFQYVVKSKKYDIAIAFSGHIKDLTFVSDNYISANFKLAWLHGAEYQYNMLSPGFFRLYKKIKNLICLSELCDADCEAFNRKNGINKKKIYNPCQLEIEKINPIITDEIKSRYGDFCLMVGRLAEDKDQAFIIRALKYLKDTYGFVKNLLLVGDGDKRVYLEKLVDELQMQNNVFFMGSRSDVYNFYCAASIYVHAAPLEGFPTVFMEAMYCGVPILSTDAVPGVREILGNDEYGMVCPINDTKTFAEKLKFLYEHEDIRNKLIKAGKLRVEKFSPEIIGKEFIQYLCKMVSR